MQELLYQLLDYVPYAPTATIDAYVNSFTVSGISTQGLGSYDVQRTFNGSSASSIDLAPSISYSVADGSVDTQVSSAQSYFFYNWDPNTLLNLHPEAEIEYGFTYNGSLPWFYWTNYAGFQHTVN